jgi:hypothetical protein
MIPFLILAACLLAAGFGVLLGSLAPHAFGWALGFVALVFLIAVIVSAIRKYGWREGLEWAALIGIAVVVIGMTAR